VPELYQGGIIIFPLNSPVDIANIQGHLEPFKKYDLSAIEFSLFRQGDNINWEEKGEIKSKINWGLHLEINPQISRLMAESRERKFVAELKGIDQHVAALPASRGMLALSAGEDEELPELRKSADGRALQDSIRLAIRNNSIDELETAVESARELVYAGIYEEKSGHAFIDLEEEAGRSAIRALSVSGIPRPTGKPPTESPKKPVVKTEVKSANADRIQSLMTLTGHSKSEVVEVIDSLGLNALAIAAWPQADMDELRDALFVDWAWGEYTHLGVNTKQVVDLALSSVKVAGLTDKQLWDKWLTHLSDIDEQQSIPLDVLEGDYIEADEL
jgi:hypothetical protein